MPSLIGACPLVDICAETLYNHIKYLVVSEHAALRLNPSILDDIPGNSGTSEGMADCQGTPLPKYHPLTTYTLHLRRRTKLTNNETFLPVVLKQSKNKTWFMRFTLVLKLCA